MKKPEIGIGNIMIDNSLTTEELKVIRQVLFAYMGKLNSGSKYFKEIADLREKLYGVERKISKIIMADNFK